MSITRHKIFLNSKLSSQSHSNISSSCDCIIQSNVESSVINYLRSSLSCNRNNNKIIIKQVDNSDTLLRIIALCKNNITTRQLGTIWATGNTIQEIPSGQSEVIIITNLTTSGPPIATLASNEFTFTSSLKLSINYSINCGVNAITPSSDMLLIPQLDTGSGFNNIPFASSQSINREPGLLQVVPGFFFIQVSAGDKLRFLANAFSGNSRVTPIGNFVPSISVLINEVN